MGWRWAAFVLLGGAILAGACRPGDSTGPTDSRRTPIPEAVGPLLFDDVTAASGLTFTHHNGEEAGHLSILESLGGGVGVLDYDGDGRLDLYLPGGGAFGGDDNKQILGLPGKLFRNRGGCRFQDVTAEVGLDQLADGKPWFYSHGVAVGDYDRDGRPDLLVTGWGRIALFHNVEGRRFEDVSARAGLDRDITWATSAAWADFDGDGWPDLYVCQYVDWSWTNNPRCTYDGKTQDVCPPRDFRGLPHKVYRNNGDSTFSDVSAACGLGRGEGITSGKGLGVVAVDVDGDGKPDVYVGNDTVDNFLYRNTATPGKILFQEQGLVSGAARDDRGSANGSMGVDAADLDGSGRPSLWVTNYENELHALYANRCTGGRLLFQYRTHEAGVAVIGRKHVGWGTGAADFDLDGWEDLFVSNGHAVHRPVAAGVTRRQRPTLLLNRGGGTFLPAGKRIGPYGQEPHIGRGLALVDLDNDGRTDLVLNPTNEPAAVLRNVAPEPHHWLGVQLEGKGHADVVGARVVLEAGDRKQSRFAKGGASYASSSDRRLIFGLAQAEKIDRLSVTWPDGQQQEWTDLAVDRYHVLVQGDQEAREYKVKQRN